MDEEEGEGSGAGVAVQDVAVQALVAVALRAARRQVSASTLPRACLPDRSSCDHLVCPPRVLTAARGERGCEGALAPLTLLAVLLACCRAQGASVFNALAAGALKPRTLASLGFERGDGVTYVHFDEGGSSGVQRAAGRIRPEESCWLPTLC